jgi:hypothetical protein
MRQQWNFAIILKVHSLRKRKQRRRIVSTDQSWIWKSGLILTMFKKIIRLQLQSEGPDGLHPMVLGRCTAELAKPLAILYGKSFEQGVVPEEWRIANVTQIFKKGNQNDIVQRLSRQVICKVKDKRNWRKKNG